jgi:serine/threonine protein kinase
LSRDDDALARVLLSGKHLPEADLERAKKLQRERHTDLDLGQVLLRYRMLNKGELAIAQKLAKMAAATPSSRGTLSAPASQAASAPPPVAPTAPQPISELDTRPLGRGVSPEDRESAPTQTLASAQPAEKEGARWKLAQDRTRFGRYEVVEKIAKGGMGIVFKVRHPELDRFFALKVLAQGEDADEEVLERFRREAKTAARLDHPSIVRVHDAGTEDGFPYIVMDLVLGDSLAKILKDEGVSPRKAALIARSVARALAHAHENGIVHRDVKPDNVLIERATGEARLSDFGIVKDLKGESESKLTRTGLTLGSPCYMSPEQAAGRHKEVGPCSDVYSLGATLYEMLAARPPFEGESIHEIMSKVVHDDPVPPRRLNPAIHPELEAICLLALEKDVRRRYASAARFAEDLDRYLEGRPVLAKPAGVVTKLWRSTKRHRVPATLGGLLVFIVFLGAMSALERRSRERRDRRERIETRLRDAEGSLTLAGKPDMPEFDVRRAYREAIKLFDRVLEEDPGNPAARDGKVRAILGLADRLLERREAGFAEFVLDQAEGLVDPAQIGSRLELAQKSEWVQKADAAQLRGDLDEALRLNREGLRALKEAGLSGELLEAKVRELEQELAQRKLDDEVKALLETAERHDASGEPTLALEALERASQLEPSYVGLKERLAIVEGRVHRLIDETLDAALSERERARAAQPEGGVSRAELGNALDQGEALARAAREKAQTKDLAGALDTAKRARTTFRGAYDISSSLAAREDARAAKANVEKLSSSKFATSELGRAEEHWEAGEAMLAAGDFSKARADFIQAATFFRLASTAGVTKQAVSAAREAARNAKAGAVSELPQAITLRAAREAETLEADAQKAEEAQDLGKARELWTKATALWDEARELGRPAQDALAARERARARKTEAETEQSAEFDAEDTAVAQKSMDEGDASLAREDFARATNAYGQAEYRWRQAAQKSAPISRPKRRIEALRKVVEDARDRATAAGKMDTKRYEQASSYLLQGEDAEKRRYWRGAEDYYTRARALFESLVPPEK